MGKPTPFYAKALRSRVWRFSPERLARQPLFFCALS